jgi:DNA uptake protein ComE-like DNA-binding protein
MHNVNRNHPNQHERGRQWRSGPDEEEQRSIPGVSAAELQSVDLNRATEGQLAEIDDLDANIAHNIVAYRVHHGHFESWEDLRKVPGIDGHHVISLQHAARIGGPGDAADAPTHRDDPTTGGVP